MIIAKNYKKMWRDCKFLANLADSGGDYKNPLKDFMKFSTLILIRVM
jgi:hypothetical protein